jgi:hypothetical protein
LIWTTAGKFAGQRWSSWLTCGVAQPASPSRSTQTKTPAAAGDLAQARNQFIEPIV